MSSCLSGLCPVHQQEEDTTWVPAGVQTRTNAHSSKRVVLSHTTSDKDRSERAAVEPTLLSTNCYCQRFSPETLPHFLKGEDESGLKRRLKCWSARSGSSGDCEWGGRGCAMRSGLTMFHVLTMFDSEIYLCVPSWNGSCFHVPIKCVVQQRLFPFKTWLHKILVLSKHFLSHWWNKIGIAHRELRIIEFDDKGPRPYTTQLSKSR